MVQNNRSVNTNRTYISQEARSAFIRGQQVVAHTHTNEVVRNEFVRLLALGVIVHLSNLHTQTRASSIAAKGAGMMHRATQPGHPNPALDTRTLEINNTA